MARPHSQDVCRSFAGRRPRDRAHQQLWEPPGSSCCSSLSRSVGFGRNILTYLVLCLF